MNQTPSTKIDTKNLFWEYAPNQSGLTNIIVLMGIIESLGISLKSNPTLKSQLQKQIIFTFLDGETYNFISSQYFTDLISQDQFPLHIDSTHENFSNYR